MAGHLITNDFKPGSEFFALLSIKVNELDYINSSANSCNYIICQSPILVHSLKLNIKQ